MKIRDIRIEWEGPFSYQQVIGKFYKGGSNKDGYLVKDYGLYQIYGPHILHKEKVLLYIGQAVKQTFSKRFYDHYKDWIYGEPGLEIFLGRIEASSPDRKFKNWKKDVTMAEAILVYKYTPHYNSSLKQQEPPLFGYDEVRLFHAGQECGKLKPKDIAPKEYRYKKRMLRTIKDIKKMMEEKK